MSEVAGVAWWKVPEKEGYWESLELELEVRVPWVLKL